MSLKHIGSILLREVRDIVPPTLFFFVAFGLLLITQSLVLEEHGIGVWHWGGAAVGALIIGKVVLVVDHLRFVDRFPHKPLIWNATWKTVIYAVAATIVHYLEELLPLVFGGQGFVAANRTILAEIRWAQVALIHMWLVVLLFVYCCLRELVRQIGPHKVACMFFHAREA